jgi:hypothetical protein
MDDDLSRAAMAAVEACFTERRCMLFSFPASGLPIPIGGGDVPSCSKEKN